MHVAPAGLYFPGGHFTQAPETRASPGEQPIVKLELVALAEPGVVAVSV
jgi:hypothetical protein